MEFNVSGLGAAINNTDAKINLSELGGAINNIDMGFDIDKLGKANKIAEKKAKICKSNLL